MSGEEALMRVAARQHAVLTHRQALACGLTREQIRWRLQSGRWLTFFPGVYVVAGAPPSYEQRAMAVALAVNEPRAISHLTAARLWGIGLPEPDAIDVLTPPGRSVRLAGVRHHRSNVFGAADISSVRGIPVTSVGRTLHDCSKLVTPERLGWIIDDAERRRLVRSQALHGVHDRLHTGPGRRPVRAMHHALDTRLPGRDLGASGWELIVRGWLVDGGLPEPVMGHRVHIGTDRFDLDMAYPWAMVDLEYDSWEFHGNWSSFHADKRRRRLLVSVGWSVVEVTSQTSPNELVANVRQLLEAASTG